MAAITVRNIPAETHRALRQRAREHGRSTEAEMRAILEAAVLPAARVRTRFRARRSGAPNRRG